MAIKDVPASRIGRIGAFVVGDPVRILDVFGLGLAVAILVDATLVRLVLVPSVMQLLGGTNGWFPTRSYGPPRGSAAPPARPRRPAGTGSHGSSRW